MPDVLGQVVQAAGLQNTCWRQGGVSEMVSAGFAFGRKLAFRESRGTLQLLFQVADL